MDKQKLFAIVTVVAVVYMFMPRWFKSNLPKRSFTLYYADWCGHCKAIKPIFDSFSFLGVEMRAIEDKENNEYPVKGFPTFVFTSSTGWSIEYSGERSARAWTAFLRSM